MPRVKAAFRWIYSLIPQGSDYLLDFDDVPDIGLSPQGLKIRIDREEKSLVSMRRKFKEIKTIIDFQKRFYSEHDAYSFQGRPDKASGDVLETY